MSSQIIASIVVFFIFALIILLLYSQRKTKREDQLDEETLTMDRLLEQVKYAIADTIKEENFFTKDDSEWEAFYKRKTRIEKSLTQCVYGIIPHKIIVKDLIASIVKEIVKTEEKLSNVINLNSDYLDTAIEFEIIMYKLMKTHGQDALRYMIKHYKLDRERYYIEGDEDTAHYEINDDDIDMIYKEQVVDELNYNEQLEIVATLLYQSYKGFGIVDTIDEMHINGYNCGTSGSIRNQTYGGRKDVLEATRSVWLYFEGKYIHAKFLTFYTQEELRRVTQLICRYNNPGPLTEKRGYVITTMANMSRVLALRPGASEYWAFFVRKFDLPDKSMEALLDPVLTDTNGDIVTKEYDVDQSIVDLIMNGTKEEIDDYVASVKLDIDSWDLESKTCKVKVHRYANAQLPINTIKYLMRGQVTTAFTGRQGSGKTTLMTSVLKYVDLRFTIRVLEISPELYLRELYDDRNILSVQTTSTVSAEELQDALKKSDAALSIVGEVAEDIIAARMLQMGQVASIFTIFSHHANTSADLVEALTNSVVAASRGGASYSTVLPQVLDVIKVDVHLDYDVKGNRYVERITEIIRADQPNYPDRLPNEPVEEYKVRLDKFYYETVTNRKYFITRDIVILDKKTNTYRAGEFFSDELTEHIYSRLNEKHIARFRDFSIENWEEVA